MPCWLTGARMLELDRVFSTYRRSCCSSSLKESTSALVSRKDIIMSKVKAKRTATEAADEDAAAGADEDEDDAADVGEDKDGGGGCVDDTFDVPIEIDDDSAEDEEEVEVSKPTVRARLLVGTKRPAASATTTKCSKTAKVALAEADVPAVVISAVREEKSGQFGTYFMTELKVKGNGKLATF